MSDSAATTVRCACGKTEFVTTGALAVTKLRCPSCPPRSTAVLRLVQS